MAANSNGALATLNKILDTDWSGKVDEIKEQFKDMEWGSIGVSIETRSIIILFSSLTVSVALLLLLWFVLKKNK